jgi:hypothetical protein
MTAAAILFAQLSRPLVLDEQSLCDLFAKSSLDQKFRNVYLTTSDTAVIWVENDTVATSLVKKGT